MAQHKDDLEGFYLQEDPWGYREHPDDFRRKSLLIALAEHFGPYERTLDIGCGEGFITENLPGETVHGIELSDIAAKRLPSWVKRVDEPDGTYDLVVATGVLYDQYEREQMQEWIEKACHVGTIVLTCHIQDWEKNDLPKEKQFLHGVFPYRNYTEVWRVYEW